VLDSSAGAAAAENRDTTRRVELDIAHHIYDAALTVHDKVALALAEVDSTYCSLCADDDVLLTDSLEGLLDLLDADSALAVAHGYYVNLRAGREFALWNAECSAPSIVAEDALRRIVKQMRRYEAIFYGVHRTSAMHSARRSLDRVTSLWAKELLTSSLTLIEGGAHRAPHYYMARSNAPSVSGEGWHPHHFFATEPAALLREYAHYRAAVLERLAADPVCRASYPREQIEHVFDLAHIKYLAGLLSADVLDYLIRETMRGESTPRQLIDGMWTAAAASAEVEPTGGPRAPARARTLLRAPAPEDLHYAGRLALLLGGLRVGERLDASLGPSGDRLRVERTARDGRSRRYTMTRALLTQELGDGGRMTRRHLADIIRHLDDYV